MRRGSFVFLAPAVLALILASAANAHGTQGLKNVRYETLKGERTLGGGCAFQPRPLMLGVTEQAISRYQVATDRAACTTLLAIGYPTAATLRALKAGGARSQRVSSAESVSAGEPDPSPPCCETGAYGSGYYELTWYDIVNWPMTKTKAELQWTWNGSCVDWAWGQGAQWHRSDTGWALWYANHDTYYVYPHGCRVVTSATDTEHVNRYFCSNDVWVKVYDAQAYGNQWGEFGGGVWFNSATHCDNRPDLHWGDVVVRTG